MGSGTPGAADQPKRAAPAGWRKWLYRLLAMTLVPALFLALLEFALSLAGFGEPTAFFLDGAPVGARALLVDNPAYAKRFFPLSLRGAPPPLPFVMPMAKPAGTIRIFVLGESAAQGFPDPSSSFARVLEAMLRERHPQMRFEVINTAMVAINSHVVRSIAAECAQYQPDLFVVLMGNNEVVGPFGAASVLGAYAPHLSLIRANVAVKTTRTGQLINRLLHGVGSDASGPRAWKGMATFLDSQVSVEDSRLNGVYAHFAANLEDICRDGLRAGAPVVVCTVPVNLKDCAPFASAHAPALAPEQLATWDRHFQAGKEEAAAGHPAAALRSFAEAEQIDDQFAELAFRLAQCHAALEQPAEACRQFARARDLDTLRFRCDSPLNAAIRAVCTGRAAEGAYLVDAERIFAENSSAGVPGEECFLEHVHLNFKGNVLLAQSVFRVVEPLVSAPAVAPDGARRDPPTEAECAAWLAYTNWNELKVVGNLQATLLKQPPFTNQFDHADRGERWERKVEGLRARLKTDGLKNTVAVYEKAVGRAESDWMLRMNFGQLLAEVGEPERAIEEYEAALQALPHNYPAEVRIGRLLLSMGRAAEAAPRFRTALARAPDYADAAFGLAEALAAQGWVDEALSACAGPMQVPAERFHALMLAGNILRQAGRTEEARQRFAEAAQREPEDAQARVALGDLASQQGEVGEALVHYEAALRLKPHWPELSAHVEKLRKSRAPEQSRTPQ